MSSLWTPYGEHSAPNTPDSGTPGESVASAAPTPLTGPSGPTEMPEAEMASGGTPYSEEELRQIAAIQQQMLSTPAQDLIANHAFGLFEIAMLHLSAVAAIKRSGQIADVTPHLESARLGIDAVAALADALGDRLAPHHSTLEEALTQARLAFVELSA